MCQLNITSPNQEMELQGKSWESWFGIIWKVVIDG